MYMCHQSYFNLGNNDVPNNDDMYGKYYFGALYGELNYYFFYGAQLQDVFSQYTTLTGRTPMPPMYAFGYHQGCYGYFDRWKLEQIATLYRENNFPIDGLHIDVDFQDNYRTFTHSENKFPNVEQMFSQLGEQGFKCCTNITALISRNPVNENGDSSMPYAARDTGEQQDVFIKNQFADGNGSNAYFVGGENYGDNNGYNPYPYPPLQRTPNDVEPLSANGYYPDFGKAGVKQWWGQNYQDLISKGLAFIWQDMTDPALAKASDANTPLSNNPSMSDYQASINQLPDAANKTMPLSLQVTGLTGDMVPHAFIHNAFGLQLSQATYEGLQQIYAKDGSNRRPFIIARGGYANGSSQPQQEGFNVSGGVTDYRLLTRWMQAGAFLPWYRNHYDGYTKAFQEPIMYGEPVPTNCRTYVELRYRLLQLMYDAMYQYTQTGMPICRPLFINDPLDVALYDDSTVQNSFFYNSNNTQFFLGNDLLVAPFLITRLDDATISQNLYNLK